MLNFPNTPNVGDTFGNWVWDGQKWAAQPDVDSGGSTITFPITVPQGGTGQVNLPIAVGPGHIGLTGTFLLGQGTDPVIPAEDDFKGTVGTYGGGNIVLVGRSAFLELASYNGSFTAPTALLNGQQLGGIYCYGFSTTDWGGSSRCFQGFIASENWTDSAQGTRIIWQTTPNGTTSTGTKLTLDGSGNLAATGSFNAGTTITSGTSITAGSSVSAGSTITAASTIFAGDTITSDGTSAGMFFSDRSTPSRHWAWYVQSNICRLFNNASDIIQIGSTGNVTIGGNSLTTTGGAALFGDASNIALKIGVNNNGYVFFEDPTGVQRAWVNPRNGDLNINGVGYKPGGGTWVDPSDRRLKKDIKPYKTSLPELRLLEPMRFRFNGLGGTEERDKEYIGFIADDVQAVMPEMVGTKAMKLRPDDETETDILTLDCTALSFAMLNAIKELANRLDALEAKC